MIPQRRGLIVEVTENDILLGGGNPMAQVVKLGLKGLALNMATELKSHGVAAIAITPGFLRSESMLDGLGVTEANWRDAGKKDKNFLESESPLFVGRAVAALAQDPDVLTRSGQLLSSWELSRKYKFTDYDGRRPDWGRLAIDFSVLPAPLIDLFRTGTLLQLDWLTALAERTRQFLGKIPESQPPTLSTAHRKNPGSRRARPQTTRSTRPSFTLTFYGSRSTLHLECLWMIVSPCSKARSIS